MLGWDEANCLEMLDEAPFGAILAASCVMGSRVSTRSTRVSPSWGDEPTLPEKGWEKGFPMGSVLQAGLELNGHHGGTLLPVWGGVRSLL